MSKDTIQQIAERIQETERILIAFPWNEASKESVDALGSALALFRFAQKLGKHPVIVADGFSSGRFGFLPHANEVRSIIDASHLYTVRINTAHAPITHWSHNQQENFFEMHLSTASGELTVDDLEIKSEKYQYDTIITVDTPDLHHLGKLFENHADMFYRLPIINIDHHSSNEQYGQINLVDINVAATGEIVADIIKQSGGHYLDEQIATNLFAAIFLKTNGFKHPTITPNTLKLAAELIQLGARREEIMQNVFRSRSLSSLRLWGRALAHLKHDPATKIAWSTLTTREILESGGDVRDLPDVIEELIFTSPEARLVALLYEDNAGQVCVLLSAKRGQLATNTITWQSISNSPGSAQYCIVGKNLVEAEKEVVEKLQEMMKILPWG